MKMLNSERRARNRTGNNFYIPPPARNLEGSEPYVVCDTRAKDRALEAKLKNAAEETKICNNSSLLFKTDENPRSSNGDTSKKKRRRSKKSGTNGIKVDTSCVEAEYSVQMMKEDVTSENNENTQLKYSETGDSIESLLDRSTSSASDSSLQQHGEEKHCDHGGSILEIDPSVNKYNVSVQSKSDSDNENCYDTEGCEGSHLIIQPISEVEANNSLDETDMNENTERITVESNESTSLNTSEENSTSMMKTKNSKKPKPTSNNDIVKGSSDKAIIARRSVEVCEDENVCPIFRNSDPQLKLSSSKGNVSCPSADEEVDEEFEWEKLLDEDFKNLRVTTTFGTDPEDTAKTCEKSPWENETNDCSIIEIYGFPEEFKTQDLLMSFSTFVNRGFKLKWVDNTHALGIFPTPSLADEALELTLPFVMTRPLNYATTASKEKAKHLTLPSAVRPQTCTALARRLVSGALGVRVVFTQAEREAERQILKQAREQKRLAAKQREAAWEGRF